ncbi:MAG: hypothetical protein EOP54_16715 [Sphingobacteriales bacterium]|nr:MAG: hypothetical protein EOP54_16715 [Sphingobacteriales bacterium]
MREELFFRVFVLPDPRAGENRLWQIWWHARCGYVFSVNNSSRIDGAFFLRDSRSTLSLTRASTANLRSQFEKEWSDPLSNARTALSWCDMSDDERSWRYIRWEKGGREEVERVTRIACIAESGWNQDSSIRLLIRVFPHSPTRQENGLIISASTSQFEFTDESRLHRVFERVRERNQGFYDEPMERCNDSLLSWNYPLYLSLSQEQVTSIYSRIALPTQHERMEATLVLRDWLAKNAADLMGDWFPQ